MAILVSVEVDDNGSLVLRNMKDALSDFGMSYSKAASTVQAASAGGVTAARQQVDAINQLISAQKIAAAEQLKYAQGWGTLQNVMKAGATVEAIHTEALKQLASATATNTEFSRKYGAELAILIKNLSAGNILTAEQAASVAKMAQAYAGAGPPIQNVNGAIVNYVHNLAEAKAAQVQAGESLKIYQVGLEALGQTLKAGKQATLDEALAMRELAQAAAAGNGFTATAAKTLADLNTKLAQGIPLTEAEIQAIHKLSQEYAVTNREALGLGSAMDALLQVEQAATAEAQKHATVLGVLVSQLQAGTQATALQKAALSEVAANIQVNARFTETQRAALQALDAELQKNGTLTVEQAAQLRTLTQAYQESLTTLKQHVSAMDELVQKQREASAEAQKYATVLQVLVGSLQAGAQATALQKQALADVAAGIQANSRFSEEQRAALQALSAELQTNGTLTTAQVVRLHELTAAYQASLGPIQQQGTAIHALIGEYQQQQIAAQAAAQSTQLYASGLSVLAATLKEGVVATKAQADAVRELSIVAAAGNGFTAEQAKLLADLNAKLAQGIPLTQAEAAAVAKLSEDYKIANREALGLGSAISMLLQQEQAAVAKTHEHAAALQLLTRELQANVQATTLQKAALAEVAANIQVNAKFTEEQKQQLQALSAVLQKNGTLTAEQAAQLQKLTAAYNESLQAERAQISALEQLFQKEQQVAQATRDHAAALAILTNQLKAGVAATTIQKNALTELGDKIQINKTFTAQHKTELAGLADALQKNGTLTKAQAASLTNLNSVYQQSIQSTQQQTTALEGLSNTARVLQGILAVLVINGLRAMLDESVRLAARIETLSVVMNVVSKNASLSAAEMRVQVEIIKRLGITTQEANDSVLQFVQANLKLADASKIARAAQDLAVIAGEASSATFQRLTRAIQTGETMLLRQVGIVTTNETIWREYAKTIGKTYTQLDALDKKQAFVNKILMEAERAAGAYEQSMSTAGKQLSSLTRFIEEAKLELGEGLVPVFGIGVRVATELLKAWLALPDPLQNLVTAGAAAIVVMTSLLAVMAASHWLGIAAAVSNLGKMLQQFFALVEFGYARTTALGMAFGAVNVWLVALIATIGLATAAWVYYNKTQEINVDQHLELIAQLEAENRSLESNFQKVGAAAAAITKLTAEQDALQAKVKLTTQEQDRLVLVTEKITIETNKYERAEASLIQLAPSAVAAIRSRETAYYDMAKAINEASNKRRDEMILQLAGAKTELARAEVVKKAAQAELEAALRTDANTQAKIKAAEANGSYTESVRLNGAAQAWMGQNTVRATVSLEALKKEQEEAGKKSAEASKAFREAAGNVDRFTTGIEAAEAALFPEKLAETNRELALVNLDKAKTGMKDFAAMLKHAGITYDELAKTFAKNPEVLSVKLKEMESAYDLHVKKMQAEAKKYAAAYDAMVDKIRGTVNVTIAQFNALNDELDKNKLGVDEYARRLNVAKDILEAFGKQPPSVQAKLANLQQGLADLRSMEFDLVVDKWRQKFDEVADSVKQLTDVSLKQLATDINKIRTETDKKFMDMAKAQDDEVFENRRELYERDVVAYQSSTKQKIYAEQKRVEDIIRAAAKEKEARLEVVAEERKLLSDRIQQARQEVEETIRKARLKAEAEIAGLRAVRTYEAQGNADKIRQEQESARAAYAILEERLDRVRTTANAEIDARADAAREIVDEHAAAATKMNAVTDALTAAQILSARKAAHGIIREADIARQFFIEWSLSLPKQFLAGLADIINGTKSWKDVLVGIFNSLKQAVFNIVAEMVEKWLKGLIQMKAASAASNVFGGVGQQMPMPGMPGLGAGANPGGGMSAMGQGLIAGGLGYGAGSIASKWADGNYGKGALGGFAAGAGAGAAYGSIVPGIGTGVGALVGGIGGLIGGMLGAKKQRDEMNKDREQLIKDMGGLMEFKRKAEEAGFAYQKLLSTKSPKEFGAEVEKLGKALEKLDLKKAREELIETSGGFMVLDRSAQLVGFNIGKLFESDNVADYNREVEKLNKLLEDQQKRLAGLGMASQGLEQMVTGFGMRLTKEVDAVLKHMGEGVTRQIDDMFKRAQEEGFGGSRADYVAKIAREKPTDLDPKVLEALKALTKDLQLQFNTLQMTASATFASILRETGDLGQAFAAIGPSLDAIIELQKSWGFETSEAFQHLLNLRQVFTDNADIVTYVSGIAMTIKGLGEAGRLTSEILNQMGADLTAQFTALTERGVSAQDAMLILQPSLQALWEAQQRYGIAVDETTQKLIDQGVEAGIIGDQHQSINQQMLDMLGLIAEALGATLPESYRKSRDAAKEAAQAQKEAAEAAGTAADTAAQKQKDYQAIVTDPAAFQAWAAAAGISAQQVADILGGPVSTKAEALAQQIRMQQAWIDFQLNADVGLNALKEKLGMSQMQVAEMQAAIANPYAFEQWAANAGISAEAIAGILGGPVTNAAEALAQKVRMAEAWLAFQQNAKDAAAGVGSEVDKTKDKVKAYNDQVAAGGPVAAGAADTFRQNCYVSKEELEKLRQKHEEWMKDLEKSGPRSKEVAEAMNRNCWIPNRDRIEGNKRKLSDFITEVERLGDRARHSGEEMVDWFGRPIGRMEDLADAARDAQREFEELGRDAENAGRAAEDAATGAAEGHSPTGMKQLVFRLRESREQMAALRRDFVAGMSDIERSASSYADKMTDLRDMKPVYDERTWRPEDRVRTERETEREQRESTPPEPPVTVVVHNTNKMDFKVERATSPDESWRELRPKMQNDLENNTQQLSTRVAKTFSRYRGRRGA